MKKKFLFSVVALSVFSLSMISCKKDSDRDRESKQYPLYNYSSGSAQPAGTFTIRELSDGNASVSIQIDQNYRVPGVRFNAYLSTADTSDFIYATLGTVDGGSGSGTISPVKTDVNNLPIPYDSLVVRTGYSIKVLNVSNVQAKGTIQ